ncbi:MAG: hypothetical protein AAGB29_13235 [Planctomycetota bacterium]
MAIGDSVFCAECGYELTGLNHAGQCPECGAAFDVGSGIGVSSGVSRRNERGDLLMKRIRTIVLALITLGIVGLTAVIAWANQSSKPIIWGALFVGLGLLATITSLVYHRSED